MEKVANQKQQHMDTVSLAIEGGSPVYIGMTAEEIQKSMDRRRGNADAALCTDPQVGRLGKAIIATELD